MNPRWGFKVGVLALLGVPFAGVDARPITIGGGTTVMAEYGAETMTELQAFYAPNYRFSVGPGYVALKSHVPAGTAGGGHSHGAPTAIGQPPEHEITYLRINYLPKRWNMESAQANVSLWASAGQARFDGSDSTEFAGNLGAQVDYETRRVYASLRSEQYEASAFRHRIDTLQLGVAPYEHEYGKLALWFLVQARQYTGEALHEGTEVSALIRLFGRKTWIEAGATQDGRFQGMLMVNF